MKKALVVLMMGALLFTACGQSTGAAGSANEPQTEEAQAEAPAEEEAEAEAPAEEAQAEAPAEEAQAEAPTEEAQAEAPAEGEEAQAEAPAEAAEETAGDEDSLGQPKAEQPDYVGYFANAETTELKDVQKLQLETENTLPDNAVKLQSVETDEGSIEEQVVDGVATLEEQDLEALGSQTIQIAASCALREGGTLHGPGNAFDGNWNTAWIEGVSGYGSGEYLVIGFPAGTAIHGLGIAAGYHKSESLFWKNSAPKTLLVGTEDNCYRLNLDPEYGYYEEFNFPSTIISDGAFVVMIENVRAGSTYKDTCISELWFW